MVLGLTWSQQVGGSCETVCCQEESSVLSLMFIIYKEFLTFPSTSFLSHSCLTVLIGLLMNDQ